MICKEHYVFLKSLLRRNGTEAKDYDQKREIYIYLFSCGYIKKSVVRGHQGYVITESGKVAIRTYKNDNFRFWFPSIMSVIAILVSIGAILTDLLSMQPPLT